MKEAAKAAGVILPVFAGMIRPLFAASQLHGDSPRIRGDDPIPDSAALVTR